MGRGPAVQCPPVTRTWHFRGALCRVARTLLPWLSRFALHPSVCSGSRRVFAPCDAGPASGPLGLDWRQPRYLPPCGSTDLPWCCPRVVPWEAFVGRARRHSEAFPGACWSRPGLCVATAPLPGRQSLRSGAGPSGPQLEALLRMVSRPRAYGRREACRRTRRSVRRLQGSRRSLGGAGGGACPQKGGGGALLASQVAACRGRPSRRCPGVLARGQERQGTPSRVFRPVEASQRSLPLRHGRERSRQVPPRTPGVAGCCFCAPRLHRPVSPVSLRQGLRFLSPSQRSQSQAR